MDIAPYLMEEGEDYMSDKQLAHLEKILLAWRQTLIEEAGKTVTHMREQAISLPDVTDCASLEEEFSLELRTRERERRLIKKINDALSRLRKDDFGYCDTCGIEIGCDLSVRLR